LRAQQPDAHSPEFLSVKVHERAILNLSRHVLAFGGVKSFRQATTVRLHADLYVQVGWKLLGTDDYKEQRIAYVRVVQFTEHTFDDLKKTVERLRGEGARGLILDLRDNPGGLLKSAVEVSDLFLSGGRIVSTKDRNGAGKSWDAKVDGTALEPAAEHPIAVLINKNSASAAEIVAAALQDNNRAVIVGERSYGKGSVQKIIKLGGDPPTALKLTTDTYWRPNGENMHRYPDSKDTDTWGVKPNPGYEIVMKHDERLEYLRYKRAKDVIRRDKPKEPEKPFVDRALDKAVEYLKGELAKQ